MLSALRLPPLYKGNPYVRLADELGELSKMIECAKLWGYVKDQQFNITKGVRTFKEEKRDRWVTPEELPKLAQAINEEENIYGRYGLWLYLLTGLRRDELLPIKHDDIDKVRKILTITEIKSGSRHYLPISAPVLKIIEQVPVQDGNPYLLPGKVAGQHLVNIEKIWFRVREKAGLFSEDKYKVVRLHDLRRSVGSWLAQSGNSLHLIGRVLNHANATTTVCGKLKVCHFTGKWQPKWGAAWQDKMRLQQDRTK